MNPVVRWDVYCRDELIHTIWFSASYSAMDVVKTLIRYDGFPYNIHVQRG